LHYQPLVVLKTNDVNAFEALLRWNHPTRGMISPADFIPIAEETGLIVPLGEWVLKTACGEAADWPDHIKVAVNLSPAQLSSRNLVSMVTAVLNESGMSPHKLQLEITETVLLQNTFRPPCTNSVRWVCRSRSTISARAILHSAICAVSLLTRSKSTARSFRISPTEQNRLRS
jgi:predicted signal transduction protein with EAL and GGDEF domain